MCWKENWLKLRGTDTVLRTRSLAAWIFTSLIGLAAPCAFAQAAPPGAAGGPPPISIKLATTDITIEKDGSYTSTSHVEITTSNDSAAKAIAQQSLPFSEVTEDLEISEAYTLKADGTKLPVEPSQIFVQAPQGVAQAPMFNDLKTKSMVFPNVAANDTVVYSTIRRSKETLFPGQFFHAEIFPRIAAWNEVRMSVSAPKSLPLRVENHDITMEQGTEGDKVVYRWHYTAPMPRTQDVAVIAPIDREPRFFVSTFKDYDELGRAFASLANPKAAVTPKVKALADEVTAGVSDRRAQTKALYEWVSKHIRYVGIEIGRGRVTPHDAETVIANGYGDCKDHVVLFAALLQAKGIRSEMALINAGNSYVLSGPPSLAQLNHVITYLPDLKLYADTTAAVAPFGTLPFIEYGKPVVHALNKGALQRTTPLLGNDEASTSLKSVTHITAEGKVQGESSTTAKGPFAVVLRQIGTAIQGMGSERAGQDALHRANLTGTASFDLTPPSDLAESYTITAHFDAQPNFPFTTGQGFPMPPGIRILPFAGDGLVGPLFARNLPASESTPCWSGAQVEDLSIEPPPGKHFAKLPTDTNVTTDNLSFTAHWTQTDRVINVHREFRSKMSQAVCTAAVRQATADALPKIAAAYPLQISLADD